ncbi:hypothetical protein H257_06398 [Aphanomyces astaci]|uniref:Uncharacterized protein n=1 Tax=Aphanomyces astaci TaxID=112090 RepID=W4GPZ6_APHAT|nr:hypothetical protein H257_06398 [Aphanomyces astaci]ETV80953.1 hypothetical protein H257_06398 [Aphanomyces astaci]|eukprot:XP_009829900.1 hypothetical protein H257_06398 [Aphanomyces astaci]
MSQQQPPFQGGQHTVLQPNTHLNIKGTPHKAILRSKGIPSHPPTQLQYPPQQQSGVAYAQPGQYGQQPMYIQQPGVYVGGQGGHIKVNKHGKVKYKGQSYKY